jgi:hypothetical protein
MQWNKTRWAFLGILSAVLMVYLLLFGLDKFGLGGDFIEVFGHLVIFIVTMISMFVFVTIHTDVDSIRIYIPIRIFRLPLATWKLVAVFMLYGVLAASAIALFTSLMAIWILDLKIGVGGPVAIAAASTAIILAWSYAQQETTPETTIVSGLVLAAGSVWLFQQQSVLSLAESIGYGLAALIFAIVIFGLAVLAFDWNRRARLPQYSLLQSSQSMGMATDVKRRFRNAKEAQRWYEWRRYGWQLPASAISIMLMYFFALPLFGTAFVEGQHKGDDPNFVQESPLIVIDWFSSVQFLTTGIQVAALLSAVAVGGFMFMKAGYWNNSSSFLFTQPVTTRKLAQARIFNIAKSSLAGVGILLIALSSVVLIVRAQGESLGVTDFLGLNYSLEPWFVLTFFWGSLLAMMWAVVWPVNMGWVLCGALLTYGPAMVYVWIKQSTGDFDIFELKDLNDGAFRSAGLPLAGIVGFGLVFMILSAIRSGQVHWISVAVVVAGWGISIWGFYTYANGYEPAPGSQISPNQFQLYPVNWPLWFALSLTIVAPPFTLPLMMHRSRHQ